MNPGICLVCHPRSDQAQADVARMLDALGVSIGAVAASGRGWAAAAIGPPTREPTCGACIHTDGQDVLIWAGEMFLPGTWKPRRETESPQVRIADAVLRRLQKLGPSVLADIDGAFCGAWYDHQRRQWSVFNDRLGLLPVFYWAEDQRVVVAPKAWLAWQASGEPLQLSGLGVVDSLRSQNMVDDHTLIAGVHWLQGGHTLEWSDESGPPRSRRYWDFHYHAEADVDQDQCIDRYLSAAQQAVRRHIDSNAPLLLGISGGLDARMLLGVCEQLGRIPQCFTAGWWFGDDVRFGRRLARAASAEHEPVPLREGPLAERLTDAIIETDGLHSAGYLAPATAMKTYLAEHGDSVLLEGYMQGVLGGAYVPDDEEVGPGKPPHATSWARRRLHSGGDVDLINGLLLPELAMDSHRRWCARVDSAWYRAPTNDPLERAEYTVASGRSGRIDVLGTGLLRRNVLVRCPACDRALLDWHASTPARLRRGKRIFMEVIRRRFPRLARVQRTCYSGLPIAEDRWLREWCWQREKLHRWWTGICHPWTRRWGTGGPALRAWTFETWRTNGQLDDLTAPDARILNWVDRDALVLLWDRARRDPLQAGPLLSLATIEIMARWLERLPQQAGTLPPGRITVRRLAVAGSQTTDNLSPIGVPS